MAWAIIFWIVMVFTRMDGASEHDGKALFKLLQPQVHQHEGNDGGSESGENDLVKERTSITEDDEPLDHSEYISNIYNSEDSEDLIARFKRQVSEEDIKQALCKDKNMGEFFRLVAGEEHCRDVVACGDHGLQAIRCPSGLAFSLRKQTCDWRAQVEDCNQKARPKLALPQYVTQEPVCPHTDEIACGDGTCLPR